MDREDSLLETSGSGLGLSLPAEDKPVLSTPGQPGRPSPTGPEPASCEQAEIESASAELLDIDADQPALFELERDWQPTWRGMPDYEHKDLQPWQTVMVHFQTVGDRRAFGELVGQVLQPTTKFIWYPKATIRTAADKVWTSGEKFTPRYPVYIISKGRWESRLTSKALEWIQIPYHIVVEPQEYDKYAAVIDKAKILTLPFSNLGQGGIPARNWVWEHAISTGAARHWILDDNIDGFCRFYDNLKVEVDSGVTFCAAEDFVDRYENVAMAAFNYDYFAPRKQGNKIRPFTPNTRCYSGILIKNDLPHRWRGRYNEDTDLSLRVLKDGWCTVLFNAFLMYKKPTLTMKGGNTDELYKGVEAVAEEWTTHASTCQRCKKCLDGYDSNALPCDEGRAVLSRDGRWLMAESLREQHPDVTRVERKWGRWQHQVDYRRFRANAFVPRKNGITENSTKYDMTLAAMPHDEEGSHQQRERRATTNQQAAPSSVSALDFVLGRDFVLGSVEPSDVLSPPLAEPTVPTTVEPTALAPTVEPTIEPTVEPTALAPTVEPTIEPTVEPTAPTPASIADSAVTTAEASCIADPRDEAIKLIDELGQRGHLVMQRDGKLLVSEATSLTPTDRDAIKRLRAELLVVARPAPIVVAPPVQSSMPAETASLFADALSPSGQSLAQFLGTAISSPSRAVTDWTPDEPPDLAGIDEVVLNLATTGVSWAKGDRPIGVTVATLDGRLTRFLPFGFRGGGNLDENVVKRWAERELRGKKIYNANTRFDVHHAREWGVDLEEQGCTFTDIMHTAALLDDHRKRFALDVLAADFLPDTPIVTRLDESRHADYHAAEAAERERFTVDVVRRLRDVLYPQIDEQELRDVQDLENRVIPAVVEMEKNGAPIDVELLEQYHAECTRRHDTLLWEVAREAGFAFDHTAKAWQKLFEVLGLPPTDGNAEAIINQIDHPVVKKAHLAAQYASLDSKTFKAYKELIGSDGILRFELNQLRGEEKGTVTGRFSAGFIQQVPNHDNHSAVFGEDLFPRRLYVPGAGQYLAADAAQIQYRIFASYAANPRILRMYAENPRASFHRMIEGLIRPYKSDLVYSHVKNMNFMRIFGGGLIKLAVMMGFITEKVGEEIRRAHGQRTDPRLAQAREIDAIYQREIPEVEPLLRKASHLAMTKCNDRCRPSDELHRQYPHRGYVRTVLGRRSRFPDDYRLHKAFCMIDQGSEGDIIKTKIAQLHEARKQTGFVMRMTVHDEISGDALEGDTLEKVDAILNAQSFPQLKVPILFECKTGANWAECK